MKFHVHKLVEITMEGKYSSAPVVFSANGLWSHIPIKPILEITEAEVRGGKTQRGTPRNIGWGCVTGFPPYAIYYDQILRFPLAYL